MGRGSNDGSLLDVLSFAYLVKSRLVRSTSGGLFGLIVQVSAYYLDVIGQV